MAKANRFHMVRFMLAGSSLGAMLWANSAVAQTRSGPGATGQTSAASAAQTSQTSAQQPASDIVVTARRRAIETATEIKRNADTVVDAVVADEAGKLPDTSVTEVLQRIPGVTMSRFADLGSPDQYSFEGSGVQIRGLSGTLGLLNGREIFSANGGSGLNFGDVTPELMAAVNVYKASTADLIEGGIGGTIDLRTRMPFDYHHFEVDGSVSGSYGDFSKRITPSASLLVTKRFNTPIGEFGALFDISYSDYQSKDSFARIEPYFHSQYQGNTVYVPGGFDYGNDQFDRKRNGYYAAFQWRPSDGLTIWQTDFISRYRTENRSLGVYPVDDESDTVANGTFDSNGIFQGGTIEGHNPTSGFAPGSGNSYNPSRHTTSDYSQGFNWNLNSRLKLSGAFQIVTSTVQTDKYGMGIGSAAPLTETIDLSGELPAFGFGDASVLTDPTQAKISNVIWYHQRNNALMHAANLDAEYDLGDGFFKQIDVGVRTAQRRETDDFVGTGWSAAARGWNGVPQSYVATSPSSDFFRYDFPDFFKGKAEVPSDYYFASPNILQQKYFDYVVNTYTSCSPSGAVKCSDPTQSVYLYGNPPDPNFGVPPSLETTWTHNLAFYGMMRFGSPDDASYPKFSGNVGVRYVSDSVHSQGNFVFSGNTTYYKSQADAAQSLADVGGIDNVAAWQAAHPGQQLPLTYTSQSGSYDRSAYNSYTYWLPSFNLAFKPNRSWIVRVAVNKTLTPPNYNDIRATGSGSVYTLPNPYATPTVALPGIFNGYTYTSGNTLLKPEISTNEDLSIEWYPSQSTTAHIDFFNKSIKNLIIYNSLDLTSGEAFGEPPTSTSTDGSSTVVGGQLNGAADYNATKTSTVRGIEIGGRTYFDMLPGAFSGFGVEANFTYIDSHSPDARALDMNGDPITGVPIVGLSKYNYNVNLLYDKGRLDMRLAYNWRSKYLATTTGNGTTNSYLINGVGDTVSYSLPVYGSATGQLDGSVAYKINKALQVAVNFTNILDNVSKTEMEILPGVFRTRSWFLSDRRFSISLRATFN